MKQTQWTIAVIVLALMVFVVTFAMNYLGGTSNKSGGIIDPPTPPTGGSLTFFEQRFPMDGRPWLEREQHSTDFVDFWFINQGEKPVSVGLDSKACRCTSVEVYVLPENSQGSGKGGKSTLPSGPVLVAAHAAALIGLGTADVAASAAGAGMRMALRPPLALSTYHQLVLRLLEKELTGTELMKETESGVASVPAGAMGWVRMRWTAERPGAQSLNANLWMDNKTTGKTVRLDVNLFFHEALRVRPTLSLGTIRDDQLEKGLSGEIFCWSTTRPNMKVEAKPGLMRQGGSPLTVGKPIPLNDQEMFELMKRNNGPDQRDYQGSVLCGYRIPVAVKASSDGSQKGFDLGVFRRLVVITSDTSSHESIVTVTGRIRGLVELGTNDEASEIPFHTFQAKDGRREKTYLSSDEPKLELAFDRERTPRYLNANVVRLKPGADGRQAWALMAEVVRGTPAGTFPRRGNPDYEDSAIYLKATTAGQPPRWIRIPVSGTALAR